VGWLSEDYEHEGWAAFVLEDERVGGGSSQAGVVIGTWDKQYRGTDGKDEIVPWTQLLGWQSKCSCGWSGLFWLRDDTDPVEFDGTDPLDARLADGTLVEDASRADWEPHVNALQALNDVEAAFLAFEAARTRLDQAVAKARATVPPRSWEAIGRKTRMTKQSAHERWGRVG
jgi:hypothetical protein